MTRSQDARAQRPPSQIEGLRNLRDVGGVVAGYGCRVREGVLHRSEAPVGTSEALRDQLAALRLRTVVDLRDADERDSEPTVTGPGTARVHIPVSRPADRDGAALLPLVLSGRLRRYTPDDLADLYVDYLERQAGSFGKVVELVADPRHSPVLLHCTAGKDRTGLAIALILAAIGVERQAILDDYAVTSTRRAYRLAEVAPVLATFGIATAAVESLFTAPPEALIRAFAHIERTYGSTVAYLATRAGVDRATLVALRDQLLVCDRA